MSGISLDEFKIKHLNQSELEEVNTKAEQLLHIHDSLKNSVSAEARHFIEENHLTISKFKEVLHSKSTSQVQNILNGTGNLTLDTIAKLAITIGKTPRITFD